MTFLFWNMARSSAATQLLPPLARALKADIIVVAELDDPGGVLRALNTPDSLFYLAPSRSRVAMFTLFPDMFAPIVDDSHLFTIRSVSGGVETFLLAAAHLPSPLYASLDTRNESCREFARHVATAEATAGHRRTVVIGDFNLNPFDAGVAFAGGFHAVSDRRLAEQGDGSRWIQEQEFAFFYNPVWRFFGDDQGTPGSYFYRRAEHAQHFWHVYDQVLIRPALLPYFRDDGIRIVTEVNGISLLNALGRPDPNIGSDHLPIVLHLPQL